MASNRYEQTGVGSNVKIGKGGPRIKNDTGAIEHRNTADSDYAVARGADPVGDNDFVTKGYLQREALIRTSGQIDGGSPPAVVNGAHYVVTTTGGAYTVNEIWYGEGGSWVQVALLDGIDMTVTADLTGGAVEFVGEHRYVWNATGSEWVDVGPVIPATTWMARLVTFAFNASSPINIGAAIPINATVEQIKVNVTQAFNGASESTLEIGDASDTDRFLSALGVDLHTVGLYVADVSHLYTSATQAIGTYVQDGATQGQARIEVVYST